jgi:diacylglycerol kinase (ATP)
VARRFQIILNPNAAGGRGRRVQSDLEVSLATEGVDHTLQVTRHPGHARTLIEEWSGPEERRVLVVGGDGTLHEVANGILFSGQTGVELAILPVGTGNDFHRMVRGSGELPQALDALLHGTSRLFEVGRARWEGGEEYFVNLMGVGLDVAVLQRRHRFCRLPGLFQYLAALGSAMVGFRQIPLRLTVDLADGDQATYSGRTLLSAITVGPSVGGGFLLSPDARPDDGTLDLFMAQEMGLGGVLRHLPRVIRGNHAGSHELTMERIIGARLEPMDQSPLYFELDGELMPEAVSYLEIEVIPAALRILEAASPSIQARPDGTGPGNKDGA